MKAYEKPKGSHISYFSDKVKLYGGINLAQGIPGFNPPTELLDELNTISHTNIHQYAPGLGNLRLLELISQRYRVPVDNLLIVQGATEGLSLIYTYLHKILNGHFATLAFDPAYESYSKLPAIFGQPFIEFPLDDNGSVNFDELTDEIERYKVKLIFLSSPGNPYGKIWSKVEVDRIVELSRQFDFYIVFDAVYDQLYFSEQPYVPVERLNDRLFVVSSFSKSLCITGWRIGYIIHHKTHAEGLQSVHDYIGLCAPSLLQQALANYLAASSYAASYVEQFRGKLNQSFLVFSNVLRNLGFHVPRIDGGCFVWAQLPPNFTDGFTFASMLYDEHKLAVIPGEHFSPGKVSWIRFNIARPMDEIRLAENELVQFIKNHAE
ncbi:MAG: pyridoxal phosphate-dependent aminotransferase [Bacteroidales bacterium]